MARFYAIHLKADNDRNGNPRRAFLVYDEGGQLVGVADEGYKGDRAIGSNFMPVNGGGCLPEGCTVTILSRVRVPVGEYREALASVR